MAHQRHTAQVTGDVVVRRPGDDDGATSGALVAPSLLLTTRDIAATRAEARDCIVEVVGTGPDGDEVRLVMGLAPEDVFVTSPALGWTLVRIAGRGPDEAVARLEGRVLADLERRLQVLGEVGARVRAELAV